MPLTTKQISCCAMISCSSGYLELPTSFGDVLSRRDFLRSNRQAQKLGLIFGQWYIGFDILDVRHVGRSVRCTSVGIPPFCSSCSQLAAVSLIMSLSKDCIGEREMVRLSLAVSRSAIFGPLQVSIPDYWAVYPCYLRERSVNAIAARPHNDFCDLDC